MDFLKLSRAGNLPDLGMLLAFTAFVIAVPGCSDFTIVDPAVVYVAFGDSATAGPSERDYPDILRERLGATPESFANAGRSGETTEDGLRRLRDLLDGQIFPNAEVLLLWQGGADVIEFVREFDPFLLLSPGDPDYLFADRLDLRLDAVQADLESAIRAADEAGLAVYVATYFPILETLGSCPVAPLGLLLPDQAIRANEYVALLNERIERAALNEHAVLVDVAAAGEVLSADPDNYFNCNHLTEAGNEIVAEMFYESLLQT